jgi:hypothetical protein
LHIKYINNAIKLIANVGGLMAVTNKNDIDSKNICIYLYESKILFTSSSCKGKKTYGRISTDDPDKFKATNILAE